MLTIVMYHYVRDLTRTRYPEIKGLLTRDFEGQLDYIEHHYQVCSLRDVVTALHGEAELPPNACLLTFDDGFIDHYETVFPLLRERNLTASFFVPAKPIVESKVLDVHKIHFVLAAENVNTLEGTLRAMLTNYYSLNEIEVLYKTHAQQGKYDSPQVVFIKKMLQKVLPEAGHAEILEQLFATCVTSDEAAFAHELYMNIPQMQEMIAAGMEIGGHGYNHVHLKGAAEEIQHAEIEQTIAFLTKVYGSKPVNWTMCYPYGSYDSNTLALLKEIECALGLTTEVAIVHDLSRPLELSRLNTNDLPTHGDAKIVSWTENVLSQR